MFLVAWLSQSPSLVSPVGRTWATSLADNSAVALRPFPAGDNGDISFWSFGYVQYDSMRQIPVGPRWIPKWGGSYGCSSRQMWY